MSEAIEFHDKPLIPWEPTNDRDSASEYRTYGTTVPYVAERDLIVAANIALELEMPLLLTGDPGCGKTTFAAAIAESLAELGLAKSEVLECPVRSESKAQDFLYHYASLRHYGDFQMQRGSSTIFDYLELRALGIGLMSNERRVILIDEIDKAHRDFPNDLLQELDRKAFRIPEISDRDMEQGSGTSHGIALRREMQKPEGAPNHLIVITSNVERQLPKPFLRRCVFYHLPFPDTDRLELILSSHFQEEGIDPDQARNATALFEALRLVPGLEKPPSTSELLNWVSAMRRVLAPEQAEQRLEELGEPARMAVKRRSVQRFSWDRVPAIGCLIKMAEDLKRLSVSQTNPGI